MSVPGTAARWALFAALGALLVVEGLGGPVDSAGITALALGAASTASSPLRAVGVLVGVAAAAVVGDTMGLPAMWTAAAAAGALALLASPWAVSHHGLVQGALVALAASMWTTWAVREGLPVLPKAVGPALLGVPAALAMGVAAWEYDHPQLPQLPQLAEPVLADAAHAHDMAASAISMAPDVRSKRQLAELGELVFDAYRRQSAVHQERRRLDRTRLERRLQRSPSDHLRALLAQDDQLASVARDLERLSSDGTELLEQARAVYGSTAIGLDAPATPALHEALPRLRTALRAERARHAAALEVARV